MQAKSTIGRQVAAAMRRGERVQDEVRALTLKALTQAQLDRAALGKVARDVLGAIEAAAAVQGETAREALQQAVSGVEQALGSSRQALRQSLEEVEGLSARLAEVARARFDAGLRAGAESGAMLARAAAGALAGFADTVEKRPAKRTAKRSRRRR